MARDTSPTDRRGYDRPAIGDDWADAWDGLVEDIDKISVERGPIADRPTTAEYDDSLYLATDQRTLWRWDAGTSDWEAASGLGTASDPVPGTSHFESVNTETLSNIEIVGPDGHNSIQSAVDDLDPGGTLWQTEGVAETGIVIDKPIRWVAGTFNRITSSTPAVDTTGGLGVTVDTHGVHFDGVLLSGSRNSGDGIKMGTDSRYCTNITGRLGVDNQGGNGIVWRGGHEHHKLYTDTNYNVNNGHLFDLPENGSPEDYFNANRVYIQSIQNDGDGVRSALSPDAEMIGNIFFVSFARNGGWGWYHEDGGGFEQNIVGGYGAEGNTAGSFHFADVGSTTDPRETNYLEVHTTESTVDGEGFGTTTLSPTLDTWDSITRNRSALIFAEVRAQTDGSADGLIRAQIDPSGGTSATINRSVAFADSNLGSGGQVRNDCTVYVPPGGQYRFTSANGNPAGGNAIVATRVKLL